MEILEFMNIKFFTFYFIFIIYKLYNFHRLFALLNGETLKLSSKMAVLISCARGL